MTTAYINRIATVVPPYDVHSAYIRYVRNALDGDPRARLFERMVGRAGITHRWSCLDPEGDLAPGAENHPGFYTPGRFPTTAERMLRYELEAPTLAVRAVAQLCPDDEASRITHLIAVTCTGFYAPGIDLAIVAQCGLNPSVERTIVGFMGCQGAVNGLRLARHIVRAEPGARTAERTAVSRPWPRPPLGGMGRAYRPVVARRAGASRRRQCGPSARRTW